MKHLLLVVALSATAWAQGAKTRVYLTDPQTWQQSSTLVQGSYTGATKSEQVKSLNKACPSVTITADQAKADFFVAWDSKTWQQTSWGGHENEFTIYNAQKDLVSSGAHHIKNAAKDICAALTKAAVTSSSAAR